MYELDTDTFSKKKFISIPNALRHPHPRDCRLAVIVLSRGFTVVTRNTRHFAGIPGLLSEDWTIDQNTES